METQMPPGEKEQEQRINRTPVQLGVSRAVYKRLRQRAREEGLPFATWLRRLALRELRHKSRI